MPGKKLNVENGEVVDSDETSDDRAELPDKRCPVCAWTGSTDAAVCPRCNYGLVGFDVRWADTVEEGDNE